MNALMRRKLWRLLLTVLALSPTLLALAAELEGRSAACVPVTEITEWQALSSTDLLVWTSSSRNPYHIRLQIPCFRLEFTNDLSLSIDDGLLCGSGADALTIHSSDFERWFDDIQTPQSCPVEDVRELDSKAHAALTAGSQEFRQPTPWPGGVMSSGAEGSSQSRDDNERG